MPTLSKLEIIDETLAMIKEHGRALKEGDCVYRMEPSTKHPGCAFGRCMNPKYYHESMESSNVSEAMKALEYVFGDIHSLDDVLQVKYQGHDEDFWLRLQQFHDSGLNFYRSKDKEWALTKHGEKELYSLKSQYEA